jgi:hypothetical protein
MGRDALRHAMKMDDVDTMSGRQWISRHEGVYQRMDAAPYYRSLEFIEE